MSTNHLFTRSDDDSRRCAICGKTRNVAAHKSAPAPEPEPEQTPEPVDTRTMKLWVGWRVADEAMARTKGEAFVSLAAKLEAKKPNSVLDRTVELSKAECEALSEVASDLENKVLGTKGAGPIVYSTRTLQARLAAFWA